MFYLIRIDDQSPFVNGRLVGSILFSSDVKQECETLQAEFFKVADIVAGRYFVFDHAHVAPTEIHEDEFPCEEMEKEHMSNTLFLLPSGELIIMDNLASIKNREFLDSPYWCSRMEFWHQWDTIFWNDTPLDAVWNDIQKLLHNTTYWNNPPTLLLSEHAESLRPFTSDCLFCGFPVGSPQCLGYEGV